MTYKELCTMRQLLKRYEEYAATKRQPNISEQANWLRRALEHELVLRREEINATFGNFAAESFRQLTEEPKP